MKFFTQTTKHSINKAICSDFFEKLPEVIRKHSDLDYLLIHQCDKGCFLKPTFRNMPYRNSFIPVVMCVFGYFLCQIATKATFNSVIKAIKKEYS